MKLGSPSPIDSGCSVAISAARHPPGEREDITPLPLKWGVVHDRDGSITKDGNDEWKHCSFSAGEVSSPADLPHSCVSKVIIIDANAGVVQPGAVTMFA